MTKQRLLLASLSVITATSFCAPVQSAGKAPEPKQRTFSTLGPKWKPPTWPQEKWTGDDSPYRSIREATYKDLMAGRITKKYLVNLRLAAKKQPSSPLAQFRWGYGVYRSFYSKIRLDDARKTVSEVLSALDKAPSPQTYEYARLRFLMHGREGSTHHLHEAGSRLLNRDPNDYDVMFYVCGYLSAGSSAEREVAMRYAQQMTRAYPKRVMSYSALATVHTNNWNLDHQLADADKAIAANRKLIEVGRFNQSQREDIEFLIHAIEREKAQRAKRS